MNLFRKPHPLEIEASRCANIMQAQLTRLNLCYREKSRKADYLQQVEFVQPLIATPMEIRCEVDVSRLPRAVTIADLRESSVLETLSVACKHPVRAEHKRGAGGGFWFVAELVERASIPKLVKFGEMTMPEQAAPLAIPIGMTDHNRQIWEDLRDLPHLLIAGATKQGKSVMVNTILCFLARRLAPEQLQLYLCDLKGGMELAYYEDLPHVQKLVTKNLHLPTMLYFLQQEMERRTELMRGKARDLDDYNAKQPIEQRLPYIVVIVDEIANAMLSKDKLQLPDGPKGTVASLTESILADLAARARATGIHLIISTQRPSVDVVTGLIKANFPCRIAFGTASEIDSRVIIDDSLAHGLSKGRMKFRRNMDLLEIQAPYLTDGETRQHIKAAIAGERWGGGSSAETKERQLIGRLLAVAEAEFAGTFPVKKLASATKTPFTKLELIGKQLEQEGILKKSYFVGKPRNIITPALWKAKYPPPLRSE